MRWSNGGFSLQKKLLWATVLTAIALVFGAGCSVEPAHGKLQVLFTGNIRGNVSPCGCKISKGGVARLASFIERNRDPNANWLMVDAGNFVDRAGATGGCSNKCQFLVTSYEDLNYDVLNIARQEVTMGYDALVALQDTSEGVEFVSANLLDANSNRLLFKPYVIKKYGNMTIGIVGLLRDADFPATSAAIDSTKLKVSSTRDAVDKYLSELKGKVNSIILLCELPSDDIDSLLAGHSEVDLVISSGALRSGEAMTMVRGTRVIGPGSSGYNGHYAMLEFNPSWGDSVAYSDYKDALIDTYEQPGPWLDKLTAFEDATGTGKKARSATPPGTVPTEAQGGAATLSPYTTTRTQG